ncbi:GD21150 [Drosophila simulans]|uniref:GD21150 n=1 Tax=Drosophila simulans TaxID=7240 RepID=B4NV87_DROSI|nr:GD21150 [Drosophila simulans]
MRELRGLIPLRPESSESSQRFTEVHRSSERHIAEIVSWPFAKAQRDTRRKTAEISQLIFVGGKLAEQEDVREH